MRFLKTDIEGLVVVEPVVFTDERGHFFESYNEQLFEKNGISTKFVQDNQSVSHKNVLRGLHFQKPPYAQAKLVRVLSGSVLDVAVDIRKDSKTYGQHYSILLSDNNGKMFYVPEGFAHGFLALEENTVFSYKCSNFYEKNAEDCLSWKDNELDIDWGIDAPVISNKDNIAISFNQFKSPF